MADADQSADLPQFVSFTKTYHNKPYDFISPRRPKLAVTGKNVVIPGGGTGIGKATAIAFAEAGAASVSILGRRIDRLNSAAEEIRKAGPNTRVLYESVDFSKSDKAKAGLQSIADQVGKIDIFIWSAGISPTIGQLSGYAVENFRNGLDIIVVGAFNAIQAFLPVAAPNADVFHISTGIAHMKPIKDMFNYATTKLAVVKLFDYLAAENPDLHVVNIQPGVVYTELNATTGHPAQDEPELPAHFTVWLASKEARFLAGKFVWVNWDAQELIARSEEIKHSMQLRVLLEGVPM